MKIGITLDNDSGLDGNVCAHFGQCAYFLIAETEGDKIKTSQVAPNTAQHGGGGCVAVDEIMKHKITHIISGGMGIGAQQKFAAAGVKIYSFNGRAKDAVEKLIKNELAEGMDACKGH